MRPPLEQGSPLEADTADPTEKPSHKPGAASFFKELPVLILIAFGLALLIKTFLIQAFWIPSESMEPTLIRGDRVLVNKLVYRFREPRRGEIIVFARAFDSAPRSLARRVIDFLTEGLGAAQPGEQDLIKRVIGLPGETVEMKDGIVTITRPDGARTSLEEPYLAPERDLSPFGPFTVPEDSFFVMGDNRAHSSDSRSSLGPIRRSAIIGKAFVRVWPPSRWDVFDVPSYGGEALAGIIVALGAPRRRRLAA